MVGFGPGSVEDRTRRAEAAILESEVIVGYSGYISRIQDLIEGKTLVDTGMRQERDRCKEALTLAASGKTVALVSSGDAGIYGMAGLAIEMNAAEKIGVPIEIVPGVTAASTLGGGLGAPLMLDYATISLSNLLVPLEMILKRVEAALQADFAIALYNPRSKTRHEPFEKAMELIKTYRKPSTPIGIGRALGSDEQSITVTDVGSITPDMVDMKSILIIGNSTTTLIDGFMITPRGY